MEKKFYPHMVGKEVLVDGEYGKVTSAWEYVGVENATLWFNVRLEDGSFSVTDSWDCTDLEDCNIIGEDMLSEVAYLMGEDIDIAEEFVYDMGYSVA